MTSISQIERLNGTNYAQWKFRMRMILTKEKTWDVASGKLKAPKTSGKDDDEKAYDTWLAKDQDALASICLAVSDSEMSNLVECENAFQAWTKLENIYEAKDIARTLYLRRQFSTLKKAEGDTIQQHINRVTEPVQQL